MSKNEAINHPALHLQQQQQPSSRSGGSVAGDILQCAQCYKKETEIRLIVNDDCEAGPKELYVMKYGFIYF